ncbi:MAG: dipeptide epimerase [Phycisphaerae bacterium]
MNVTWTRISIKPATPFRTARAVRNETRTLWVRIESDGIEGWGEAAPLDTYHQSVESAEEALRGMAPIIQHADPLSIESITAELLARFDDQRAAIAAIDGALHDWIGKRFGVPVVRWLGLDPSEAPLTSYTIGIDTAERIAEKTRKAASFPILKIKIAPDTAEEALSIVRGLAPEKTLRVDANASWSVDQAIDTLPRLAAYGVEFVEQPIPAGDLDGLKRIRDARILPIIADESCVRPADVVALAGRVDGVNIKLGKCGGLREALRMIHLGRAFGMKIMLGCMIETSLGIAAAAQLAPLADWLDLDGHLLLAHDPFDGLEGAGGRLRVGATPGLGVTRRECERV